MFQTSNQCIANPSCRPANGKLKSRPTRSGAERCADMGWTLEFPLLSHDCHHEKATRCTEFCVRCALSVHICSMCSEVYLDLAHWTLIYELYQLYQLPKKRQQNRNLMSTLRCVGLMSNLRPKLGASTWNFAASASISTNAAPESPPTNVMTSPDGIPPFLSIFWAHVRNGVTFIIIHCLYGFIPSRNGIW